MLVRKAVDIGADKTYTYIDSKLKNLFEKVGFIVEKEQDDTLLMVKYGDVGGHCCGSK